MVDTEKLKYDLAMQSALAATILNRNSDESISTQMMSEFTTAYNELSLMSASAMLEIQQKMQVSKQLNFEKVNSRGKRNI